MFPMLFINIFAQLSDDYEPQSTSVPFAYSAYRVGRTCLPAFQFHLATLDNPLPGRCALGADGVFRVCIYFQKKEYTLDSLGCVDFFLRY